MRRVEPGKPAALGWQSLPVWECEVRKGKVLAKAARFLRDGGLVGDSIVGDLAEF